ncbi:MAG: thioredoxin family protein [Candidatus Paceibacterota bacterium]|nr:thioredoxin family protein [Candidatus Paceibacterota bacterium]MDD5555517.1 thioredoxin family protein [Candidatus Paceibacterota bacterium]
MENKRMNFLSSVNFWRGTAMLFLIGCVGLAVTIYQDKANAGKTVETEGNVQISQSAVDKAMKYINDYLLGGGSSASLSKVYEEGNPYYKIEIDIAGNTYPSYVSSDGKYLFANEPYEIPEFIENEIKTVDGNFKEVVGADICSENGKPIVYFFGSASCSHCAWEKPVLQEVVKSFGDKISYHENIDTNTDQDVFEKYSNGSFPTLVLGCRYYRLGSGEADGEQAEKEALTKLICSLTQNQPEGICE